ncbi:MAG: alpha-L-glutamate ligase-like protein, partial [Planctomycetota bacterium]
MSRSSWRWWAWPRELRESGIFGINRRNLELMSPLNPRKLYPRVDDKVITKETCQANGIAVPVTYAVLERFGDVRGISELLADHAEFVIKPARGAGGRGILVVVGRDGGDFRLSGDRTASIADVRYHLASILAGLHSLGGRPDRAIIEERINRHAIFEGLAVGGTPDIRVICHQGTPAIAMLRLPTRASGGRANLHQGAVGAGVDIRNGTTLGGVQKNRTISTHPDTGVPVAGHRLPDWGRVLDVAARLSRALELGYVGIDIVLDSVRGPLVLEANARPGLGIQIANHCGLRSRLER